MRDDEVRAKEIFDLYLESRGFTDTDWTDGNQNNPPDFHLNIDGVAFAVEVTALKEYVRTPRRVVPRNTIYRSAIDVVKSAEKAAKGVGILRGTYGVLFARAKNDFYPVRASLKKVMIEFLRTAGTDNDLTSKDITLNGRNYCTIIKLSGEGSALRWLGGHTEVFSMTYIDREVNKLLQDALTRKHEKLVQFSQPKILILIGAFTMIDPQVAQQCIPNLEHLEDFHTVFIIASENFILYSKNPNWY